MIVKIEKNGYDVKVNGVQAHINPQASHGPNSEIAEIGKIVGPEWQQSISLNKLEDGIYDYELNPRKEVKTKKTLYTTTKNYTQEQLKRIEELKQEISKIEEEVEIIKIPNTNLTINEVKELCKIEKVDILEFIENLQKYTKKDSK